MHIERYAFGSITINGKTYTSDVIVYPDHVDESWWRTEGHSLRKEDLKDIIEAGPDLLIIGTGSMGVLNVPEHLISYLQSQGMAVIVAKTGAAVEQFNRETAIKRVIGAFHLTC